MASNMYYTFHTKPIWWEGKDLHADIPEYLPIYKEYQELWWYGQPLPKPIAEFKFTIDEHAPKLDNYWTGNLFTLYSGKLISILREAGVRHETFPATILGTRTGQIIPGYALFRLLEMEDALDPERSEYGVVQYGRLKFDRLNKLVLKESFLGMKKLMCRIRGQENLILIHQDLKQILETAEITGCDFIPLDASRLNFNFPKLSDTAGFCG
jgi:hypothetical protein